MIPELLLSISLAGSPDSGTRDDDKVTVIVINGDKKQAKEEEESWHFEHLYDAQQRAWELAKDAHPGAYYAGGNETNNGDGYVTEELVYRYKDSSDEEQTCYYTAYFNGDYWTLGPLRETR